ncbi:MAG: hypothetical protein E6K10_01775 [Methanobacteriota archaeon]|nr:MAG: hypothetical protein E6K10_01775 [Euryarchaeota archaeon]
MSQATVGERILVHLSWYLRFADAFECPRETTQDGIARALGISRAHAALELKRLRAAARAEERMAHVVGGRSRRKVYFLTPGGASAARSLRDHAREKSVLLADHGERREVSGAEAIEALKSRGVREPEATLLILGGDLVDARGRRPGAPTDLPLAEPFVGRDAELATLASWLASPGPLALVLGVAGIGKTALVARAATLFEGAVWYRKMYGFEDARGFAAALGDFLHRIDRPRLRNYLASGGLDGHGLSAILQEDLAGVLLVVDDVHAASDVAGLLRLAADAGCGKVLAAARDRPDALAGVDGAVEVVLGGLGPEASRDLVSALTGRVGDRLEPILAAGRGHPMALRILARSDPSTATGAERVIEDAILEGMDADLEAAAAALAVLRAPCPRPAELGISPSRLRRLLRRGLVARGPRGVALHDLVRDVLLPRLPPAVARGAHREAARAAEAREDPIEAAYHLAQAERPRAARDLLVAKGPGLLDSPAVAELARLLARLPMSSGSKLLLAEALDRLGRGEEAPPLLDRIAGDPRHPRRAEALLLLGRIASRRNELPAAQRHIRDAVAAAVALGDPRLEGAARRLLAVVRRKAGDADGAEAELDRAIPLLETAGDPRERVRAHLDRATVRLQRGDPAGAGRELETLLADAGAGPREEAAIRSNLAIAWAQMGRADDAAVLFEGSARAAERGGDFRAAGYALANAADAYLASGRGADAQHSLARAREISSGFADPLLESTILTNEGKVLASQGRPGPAEERLRAGVERIRGLGNVVSLIARVDELARFYESAGRAEEALRCRRETEEIRASARGMERATPSLS